MVYRLWIIVKQFKFGFSWPLLIRQFLILAVVLSIVVAVNVSKFKSLQLHLPLNNQEKAIIVKDLPSNPSAPLANQPAPISRQIAVGSKAGSSSNPLCKGITDPWTMVPDPSHEGEYVICNVDVEEMATLDELNNAQNEYRRDHSLNTLTIDSALCTVASQRAKEISTNFSHDGFEAAIDRNGINRSGVGENIASGPLSGVHFVQWAWDRSPGHRENMLRDWAVGCGGVYDRFAVFIFGK